jgi:anti-sigma regulatory factor (Ser/Thr protein kinase)
VEHAFEGAGSARRRRPRFVLAVNCRKDRVTATFFDGGASFDAQAIEPPDVRKNLSGEKRGGYGVFLIRKLVDKIVYSARRRLNITRLVKQVQG